MARPRSVARSIRVFADQNLSPVALSANLARIAVQKRDALIQQGDAPPHWSTNVDGRLNATEASVRPDGFILYKFNVLGLAAQSALTLCQQRSPVRSGAYQKAWAVIVDGHVWEQPVQDIPDNVEVMIVNPRPYARKIDTGGMKMSVPPGIIDAVRRTVQRRFPTINAVRAFVTIPSGLLPDAPYRLKRDGGRKHQGAGSAITYPALILSRRQ